jgi:hypothetical protein
MVAAHHGVRDKGGVTRRLCYTRKSCDPHEADIPELFGITHTKATTALVVITAPPAVRETDSARRPKRITGLPTTLARHVLEVMRPPLRPSGMSQSDRSRSRDQQDLERAQPIS